MLSRLLLLLKAWTRRERFENALDEEVRFHLEACTGGLGETFGLDEAALRAARGYRYRRRDTARGAVAVRVALEFTFTL